MSKLKIRNGNTWEEIPAGGVGVPPGGTQGQALLKSSNTDYSTTWGNVTQVHVGQISIASSGWTGSDPYTQTVTVSGTTITSNSKVDIQPNATAIQQMITDGCAALYIDNNNGTLTAYAIGSAPTANLTVQVTVTEVV